MMKENLKKYEVTLEWSIKDTRDINGGWYEGTSIFVAKAKTKMGAINQAISFAGHLPLWEFERNGINLEQYREGNICRYHYMTQVSRIINVKVVK